MEQNSNRSVKTQVEDMLRSTGLDIAEQLIAGLNQSNYYSAHCFSHHHYPGGLAKHSLGVAQILLDNEKLQKKYDRSDLIIAGLFHDVCKADHPGWRGIMRGHHGKRSVHILGDYFHFHLNDDVHEAIRNHMHCPTTEQAKRNPLWGAIRPADHKDAARG